MTHLSSFAQAQQAEHARRLVRRADVRSFVFWAVILPVGLAALVLAGLVADCLCAT